jgi:ABC-type oligopeptide transport system substrate-binding subunit
MRWVFADLSQEKHMKTSLLAGASALLLGACAMAPAALPETEALNRVAAQSGPYRALGYQSPFAGFEPHAPTGPASWRAVNDAQTEG